MCQKYQPNLGMKSMGAFKVTEGVFHSNYSCRSKGRWLCSIAGRSGRCGDSNLGYMAQERTGPRNHSTKTYRARNADCTPCVICWRSIASTAGLWRVERECHRTPEDLKHAKWMQSGLFQGIVSNYLRCTDFHHVHLTKRGNSAIDMPSHVQRTFERNKKEII